MSCNCCEITDKTFGEESARGDLKQYRKRGPAKQTRLLLEGIRKLGLKDAALLDIGGGIGTIHHELLGDVAQQAIHVDESSAYLKEAKEEAARRGHSDQVTFIHADFTDVAPDVASADIVTLDRVVCCYPDYGKLLQAAAEHSTRAIALTYPRETWYMRIGLVIINFLQRLWRDPFRVFLHPVTRMDSLLRTKGFERVFLRRLFTWEVVVYRRVMSL